MQPPQRSVMFVDVCDSSRLFAQRGDAAARAAIRKLLARCAGFIESSAGTVIKTIGDELMVAFDDIQRAVAVACSLLRERDAQSGDGTPGLRIGLHHGDVLLEGNDLYGSTVNTAARMVAMARCGQLIVTGESLRMLCPETLGVTLRSLGSHHLPGLRHPLEVTEILWQDAGSVTSLRTQPLLAERASHDSLRLHLGAVELCLAAGCEPFSLGRDTSADLVVDSDWVSRLHAIVEYRRGFFVLRDVSTNGSFVAIDGSTDLIALHRNELTLRGNGMIGLGREPVRGSETVLHFSSR